MQLDRTHGVGLVDGLSPPRSLGDRDRCVVAGQSLIDDEPQDGRPTVVGLVIEITSFPGWESIGAMASHFRFVRDHHKHIKKIAVVTDSPMGNVAEHLASTLWQPRSDTSLRENLKRQSNGL